MLKGHEADVNWLAFSPDGRWLASASEDQTIRLWDLENRSPVAVLRGHQGPVESIAFAPDGRTLVSGGKDGVARLWDVPEGRLRKEFSGHTNNIEGVAFAPDGKSFVTGSFDGTARIVDVAGDGEPRVIDASRTFLRAIGIASNGSTVATVDDQATVSLFDATTGKTRVSFPNPGAQARGVCFTPDDQCVVSCNDRGYVHAWLYGLPTLRMRFKAHEDRVWSLAFSPNGRRLVTTGSDRTAVVWDWPVRVPAQVLTESREQYVALTMAPDGRSLAIREYAWSVNKKRWARMGKRILVWDCVDRQQIGTVPILRDEYTHCAWSPDSVRLAVALADGTLLVWDRTSQQIRPLFPGLRSSLRDFNEGTGVVTQMAFSPEGRRLVVACSDATIRILDLDTRRERLEDHIDLDEAVTALSWPKPHTIALTWQTRYAEWDPRSQRRPEFRIHSLVGINAADLQLDPFYLALGRADGAIAVHRAWKAGTETTLLGHRQDVAAVAFDPTGKTLASGSADGTVRLWNVATGKQLLVLEDRHFPGITSVAFGLEGRLIAVAGAALDDGSTVTLHDAGPSFVPASAIPEREPAPDRRTSLARDLPGH